MTIPIIPRSILAQHFGGDRRMIAAFEDMNAGAAETQADVAASLAATESLQDATVIVLSANEAFANERILKLADGLEAVVDDTYVTIQLSEVARALNYTLVFVAAGDSTLNVPVSGTVAVEESVNVALGNYANDAAAAAGGVPINGRYRNGSTLMLRVT